MKAADFQHNSSCPPNTLTAERKGSKKNENLNLYLELNISLTAGSLLSFPKYNKAS